MLLLAVLVTIGPSAFNKFGLVWFGSFSSFSHLFFPLFCSVSFLTFDFFPFFPDFAAVERMRKQLKSHIQRTLWSFVPFLSCFFQQNGVESFHMYLRSNTVSDCWSWCIRADCWERCWCVYNSSTTVDSVSCAWSLNLIDDDIDIIYQFPSQQCDRITSATVTITFRKTALSHLYVN